MPIAQSDNTIFLSGALSERYPFVYARLKSILSINKINVRTILGTGNIWIRDWFPVQTPSGFVKFAYKGYGPDAYDKYPQLIVPEYCWRSVLHSVKVSDIILDGGNIERYGDRVIMTEIVFTHNPGIERTVLLDQLEQLLEAQIIIVPVEPGDDLGHTDGAVRWIDYKTVFVNQYHGAEEAMQSYSDSLRGILEDEGIATVPFPNNYHYRPRMTEAEFREKFPQADDWNSGWGYAINFLHIANTIIFPAFGIHKDECAACRLKTAFPEAYIDRINCADLSQEGGLVNCVTSQAGLES
jgi:agmatine/peptidylarginine deiminase